MSLYIDSAIGTCRTKVFTCATAYAALGIDYRYLMRTWIVLIRRHHLYRSCRTMTLTIAAMYVISNDNAVLAYPYGMAYLHRSLFLLGYGLYSTNRTHL
jgi:hypothetical protein